LSRFAAPLLAAAFLLVGCDSARCRTTTLAPRDQAWWGGERVLATNVCSRQGAFADGAESWIQWKSKGGASVRSPWLLREMERFADREGLERLTFTAPRPPAPFGEWQGREQPKDVPLDTVTDFAWCVVSVQPIVLVAVEHRISYARTDQARTSEYALVGPWPAVLLGYGLLASGRVPLSQEVVWCSPTERILPCRAAAAADGSRVIQLKNSMMTLRPKDGMWEVVEVRGRSGRAPSVDEHAPLDLHAGGGLLPPTADAPRGGSDSAVGRWTASSAALRVEIELRDDGTGAIAYAYLFLPTVYDRTVVAWSVDGHGRVRIESQERAALDPGQRDFWNGQLRRGEMELDLASASPSGGGDPGRLVMRFVRD